MRNYAKICHITNIMRDFKLDLELPKVPADTISSIDIKGQLLSASSWNGEVKLLVELLY